MLRVSSVSLSESEKLCQRTWWQRRRRAIFTLIPLMSKSAQPGSSLIFSITTSDITQGVGGWAMSHCDREAA
jgi:hypothetical protein